MPSSDLEKIIILLLNEDLITLPGLMHKFVLDFPQALDIYSRIKVNKDFQEDSYIECPNCSSDCIYSPGESLETLIGRNIQCEHCDKKFTVASQDIFKILVKKKLKKKAS